MLTHERPPSRPGFPDHPKPPRIVLSFRSARKCRVGGKRSFRPPPTPPSNFESCKGQDTPMPLNRSQRAQMAQETVQIIGDGHYMSPAGQRVDISEAVAASVAGTREFPPNHAVPLPH